MTIHDLRVTSQLRRGSHQLKKYIRKSNKIKTNQTSKKEKNEKRGRKKRKKNPVNKGKRGKKEKHGK